jgi:UDPglucose 6-dehydrogenase
MKMLRVGFIGLGALGRIAAETISDYHSCFGYDIDPQKMKDFGELHPAPDLKSAVYDMDIVLIAVQTPHDPLYDGKEPTSHLPPKDFNYEYVIDAVKEVDEHVTEGTPIAVISTVLPGTIRKQIAPLIKRGRFVYNPYLIAQGTVAHDMQEPEMIMIGTEDGKENDVVKVLYDLYDPMVKDKTRFEIGTWEEIEATKVFYNTFISTKLALVNMIQDVAENVGHMNVDVVTDALKKSNMRIMGPSYMKAGFGDGGACHPRDNIALRVLNERYKLGYDLFDAIMKAREEQAANMARKCLEYNMDVVILGMAFKPGLQNDPLHSQGSPSMLVGWYIEKLDSRRSVYYSNPDIFESYTYLIHDKDLIPEKFNPGSVIIDPHRELEPSDATKDCKIIHYGNSR